MGFSHNFWRVPSLSFVLLPVMLVLGGISGCSSPQYRVAETRCGLLDCLEEEFQTESMLPEEIQAVSPEDSRLQRKIQNLAKLGLRWPLRFPVVTSRFGLREATATRRGMASDVHDGIDLRAAVGTPIYASHDGKIIYSGQRIAGYGKMIVLKHPKNFSTLYAHQSRLKVRAGQWVKRGQLIGYTGATGNVSGPHLHFELRIGTVPVDPIIVLKNSTKNRKIALGDQRTPRSQSSQN